VLLSFLILTKKLWKNTSGESFKIKKKEFLATISNYILFIKNK
tara:strand:- start:725 stop:853 length:129 start_codon:yes stop_codon:yes gene_type:complete